MTEKKIGLHDLITTTSKDVFDIELIKDMNLNLIFKKAFLEHLKKRFGTDMIVVMFNTDDSFVSLLYSYEDDKGLYISFPPVDEKIKKDITKKFKIQIVEMEGEKDES